MALPLLIPIAAAAVSFFAGGWAKDATAKPSVIIEQANVTTEAQKQQKYLMYGGVALIAYLLFFRKGGGRR